MTSKRSIRFYKDHIVRAVWDDENNHWWFSVLDIVGAINEQDDHEKNRNYWKYLKAKLRKEHSELVSDTTQLKLTAPDGKKYITDKTSKIDALTSKLQQEIESIKEYKQRLISDVVTGQIKVC